MISGVWSPDKKWVCPTKENNGRNRILTGGIFENKNSTYHRVPKAKVKTGSIYLTGSISSR
jgi:hypothetical protein